MKKLSLVATATLLLFSLTACSSEKKSVSNNDESTEITETKKSYSEESSSSSSETEVSESSSSSSEAVEEPFDPSVYRIVDFNEWNHDNVPASELLQVTGTVIQAQESDGDMTLRIAINDDYNTVILASILSADYKDVIAEDDNVTVYGLNMGLTSYETVLGNKQTIPSLYATNYTVNSYGQ